MVRFVASLLVVIALAVPAIHLAVPLDCDSLHATLKHHPESPRTWRSGIAPTPAVGRPAAALIGCVSAEDAVGIAAVVLDAPFVPPRS